MKQKRFDFRKTIALLATILLLAVAAAGCTADDDEGGADVSATATVVDFSEQAEIYIAMSRQSLADEFGVDAGAVDVESVTEPDVEDGTYVIVLTFSGQSYEYHGQDGEVARVSEPLPTEPVITAEPTEVTFTYAPAQVDEVEVVIDRDAEEPVQIVIRGQLRSGCEELFEHSVEMVDDTTFAVELTASTPEGVPCTTVLEAYEEFIPLTGTSTLDAGEYTVTVNNQVTTTFTWEGMAVDDDALPAVDFALDETIYDSQVTETVPAVDGSEGDPFWSVAPTYSTILLEGYNQTTSIHEPRVFIYPVETLRSVNETAAAEIEALQEILAMRAEDEAMTTTMTMTGKLPFLPLSNAMQMMQAQVKYLDFATGSGIRYVTQYGQAANPINNQELVYTFQGLTDDNAFYIAAVLPVSYSDLPADAGAAPADFADNYEGYIAGIMEQLNNANSEDFTPDLTALDALVSSTAVNIVDNNVDSAVPDTAVHTHADLVFRLEDAGAEVAISSEPIAAVDILSIPGSVLFVNGEEVELYIYDTAEAAMTDAARISADASEIAPESVGDNPPTVMDWDGVPHFFRWDNIIVLYVGENSDLVNLLMQVLGEPFAGPVM